MSVNCLQTIYERSACEHPTKDPWIRRERLLVSPRKICGLILKYIAADAVPFCANCQSLSIEGLICIILLCNDVQCLLNEVHCFLGA